MSTLMTAPAARPDAPARLRKAVERVMHWREKVARMDAAEDRWLELQRVERVGLTDDVVSPWEDAWTRASRRLGRWERRAARLVLEITGGHVPTQEQCEEGRVPPVALVLDGRVVACAWTGVKDPVLSLHITPGAVVL